MIKLYICKNKKIEITFRNCLIFRDDKLSTILLQKKIIYCGRNKSFPNQVLSSLEMALSLNPQELAQSHIEKDASHSYLISLWPKDECTTTTQAK